METTLPNLSTSFFFVNETEMQLHNTTAQAKQNEQKHLILIVTCILLSVIILMVVILSIYFKKCKHKAQNRSPIYTGKIIQELELTTFNCSHI